MGQRAEASGHDGAVFREEGHLLFCENFEGWGREVRLVGGGGVWARGVRCGFGQYLQILPNLANPDIILAVEYGAVLVVEDARRFGAIGSLHIIYELFVLGRAQEVVEGS